MDSSLIFVLFCLIFSSLGAPTTDDSVQEQLSTVLKQLDRVELQLNNSLNQLLEKLDENNRDITSLIKSMHSSKLPVSGKNSANEQVNALLIIDVQNDFISGSLALKNCPSKHNGEEVVPVINQLLATIDFDVVVYSLDWHPTDHISFFDNLPLRSNFLTNDSIPLADLQLYSTATFAIKNFPPMKQALWPRHCVQNSSGAQLHPDLKVIDENNNENISVINIYKGTNPDIDSYSAFWDNFKLSETGLQKQLKERNVTQVFVVGLATDWCVYSTALHAIENGYKTFIIEDACRGVDEKTIQERLNDFAQHNGYVIQSNQVKYYVQ